MKIEFDTSEILNEEDIKSIATDVVSEYFKKELLNTNGLSNISFFIYEGVLRDILKDKEVEILQMVNDKINRYNISDYDIKYHTNVSEIITNTIKNRKAEFEEKGNKEIDRILAEEDWKYEFLRAASEILQEVFISNMYDCVTKKDKS